MKELRGTAHATVAAPLDAAFALLHDLDRYSTWYPEAVRHVQVVDRDAEGLPSRAETTLHLSYGPIVRDFHLLLAVSAERPALVSLKRIPHGSSDGEEFRVTWRLREGTGTQLDLDLGAALAVPRFLPVGGIGDHIAQGFMTAAVRALGS